MWSKCNVVATAMIYESIMWTRGLFVWNYKLYELFNIRSFYSRDAINAFYDAINIILIFLIMAGKRELQRSTCDCVPMIVFQYRYNSLITKYCRLSRGNNRKQWHTVALVDELSCLRWNIYIRCHAWERESWIAKRFNARASLCNLWIQRRRT
jgi:hypothetical protein